MDDVTGSALLACLLIACGTVPARPLSNSYDAAFDNTTKPVDDGRRGESACSSFHYWARHTLIVFGGCWWVRKETP